MLINPNKGDLYMENNNYYKYVSRDEFGTVYIVLPNTEKGFNCGYSLFIPTGCNIDTTLLVHCCNTGGYGVTDGVLDSSKRAIHLDEANEAAKISSLGGHLNYGYELKKNYNKQRQKINKLNNQTKDLNTKSEEIKDIINNLKNQPLSNKNLLLSNQNKDKIIDYIDEVSKSTNAFKKITN